MNVNMAEVQSVRARPNISMACQLCSSSERLMVCSGCRRTWYCSKEHQKLDWKYHKKNCKHMGEGECETKHKHGITLTSSSLEIPRYKGNDTTEKMSAEAMTHNMNKMSQSLHDDLKLTDDKPSKKKISEEFYKIQSISSERNVLTDEGSSESYILHSAESALNQPVYNRPTSQISSHSQDLRYTSTVCSYEDEPVDNMHAYLSVLESRNEMLGEYVVKCLQTYGICVIDNFLGETKGLSILAEVKELHDKDKMTSGELINRSQRSNTQRIRDDMITWVDGREIDCSNIQFLISSMDAVILKCTRKLTKCTINGRTKAMVACYPGPSSGYLRHVDNPNKDGRAITCIYYLNKDWDSKTDGGTLHIYPEHESRIASIEPTFDRLLFFWSDRRNPHEVMPTNKTRYAITVWYYDAVERKQAVEKFTEGQKHAKSK
ncbi:egl nine homolog 1-like isoform X3 [Ostrea edulis]|uniref:egl nine homolog 1-like isoform X3 n=1 Tax=Ostrea edulis TaxID=37623 RepID=UPI0024AF0E7F|nr:egl nine homolog 1-like isoform X3 [Ostrea edulis]